MRAVAATVLLILTTVLLLIVLPSVADASCSSKGTRVPDKMLDRGRVRYCSPATQRKALRLRDNIPGGRPSGGSRIHLVS